MLLLSCSEEDDVSRFSALILVAFVVAGAPAPAANETMVAAGAVAPVAADAKAVTFVVSSVTCPLTHNDCSCRVKVVGAGFLL